MLDSLRRLTIALSAVALLAFALLAVNQTAGVVQLLATYDPRLGRVALVVLLIAWALVLATPVLLYLRLQRPLDVPATTEGPEYDAYLARLGVRLAANPRLRGRPLGTRDDIAGALQELGSHVDTLVKAQAGRVFLATAVSQSGRLDAFMVLGIQAHMIWEIAHVYAQRPALPETLRLYTNVVATAFIAGSLEEIDPGEQIAPVISAALPAMAAELPGFRAAGTVFANSVMTGSANAFLTLRVGMVAKRYCAPLVAQPRGTIRRAAIAEATRLLAEVVAAGTARLSKAVWDASRQTVGSSVAGAADLARSAGQRALTLTGLGRLRRPPKEETE